ncbi:MAG: hypothetical protein Q9209_001896, partial [Squamulea sp. 1 TL-2023]
MGLITILDSTYKLINNLTLNDGILKAGESMQNGPYPSNINIHENFITAKGSPTVTTYSSTLYDLSAVGDPKDGWLLDRTDHSMGLTLYLDLQKRMVETVSALQDPQDTIYADCQGTYQHLPHDHKFLAYGQIPKFKEYENNDRVVMEAKFGQDNQVSSCRSHWVSDWSATPYWAPKIATTQEPNGNVTLSISWNVATPDAYNSWIVYESNDVDGPFKQRSQQVRKTGFETNTTLSAGTRSVMAAV